MVPSQPVDPATVVLPPDPPPNPHGRAGRDLGAAIGVGVGLAALVILTLVFARDAFRFVIAVAMVLGAWELSRAIGHRGLRVPLVPVALGCVGMVLAAYERGGEALTVTFGLTAIGVLLWRVLDPHPGAAGDIAAGIFTALYPGFLGGFAAMLLAPSDGGLRIFTFVLVTVCSDIGGYVAGVLFGKHPMAPRISPKKTWEGFTGSVLTCAIAGALCIQLLFDQSWLVGVALGALVAAAATIGDLMESVIKRDLGVKDMSDLLPGHGGLMDRLDSLIVCAPLCWAVLTYLVPVS